MDVGGGRGKHVRHGDGTGNAHDANSSGVGLVHKVVSVTSNHGMAVTVGVAVTVSMTVTVGRVRMYASSTRHRHSSRNEGLTHRRRAVVRGAVKEGTLSAVSAVGHAVADVTAVTDMAVTVTVASYMVCAGHACVVSHRAAMLARVAGLRRSVGGHVAAAHGGVIVTNTTRGRARDRTVDGAVGSVGVENSAAGDGTRAGGLHASNRSAARYGTTSIHVGSGRGRLAKRRDEGSSGYVELLRGSRGGGGRGGGRGGRC